MSFYRGLLKVAALLAFAGLIDASPKPVPVVPKDQKCIPNPSVVTVEVIQTLVVCPVLLSTFIPENTKITLAPSCTITVTNAPTLLSTVVTITTLSESSVTQSESPGTLSEHSAGPSKAPVTPVKIPITATSSTELLSPSSTISYGQPGSTSTSGSVFGCLPGIQGLVPVQNPSCDGNNMTNLVPSYTAILDYAKTAEAGATNEVELKIEMLYPEVTLENSAYIKSVVLSGDLITITLTEQSAFDICKAWPQDDFILITYSEGCNPTNERGLYQVSGFSVDSSALEIILTVTACTWESVAVTVVISNGTGGTGKKHSASYTSSTTSHFSRHPSSQSSRSQTHPTGSSLPSSSASSETLVTSSNGGTTTIAPATSTQTSVSSASSTDYSTALLSTPASDSSSSLSSSTISSSDSPTSISSIATYSPSSSSTSETSSGTGITSGTESAFAGPTMLSSAPKVILAPTLPPGTDAGSLEVLSPYPTTELWYGGGGNSTGNSTSTVVRLNITYLYPSIVLDHSAYISLVSCSNSSLVVTFNSTDPFLYAEGLWPANPQTIFITGAAGCGTDGQNAFFLASSLTFNRYDGMTCTAIGQYVQLKDVMSDMDMDWGEISPASDNSTDITTCGSPSSSTINGLPAAACGSSFDQALDDALGYYSGQEEDAQTVFGEVAPGAPSIGLQRRHWWNDVINAVETVVTYVVKAVVTVVQDTVAIAKEVAQEAAAAAEAAAVYAAEVAEAVIETGIDLVTSTIKLVVALVTGTYSDKFDIGLDIGPPNSLLESSPWGPMGFKFYSYTVDPEDSGYSAYANTLEVISQDLIGGNNNAPGIEFWCLNCGIEGDIKATGTLSASIKSGITKGQITISGDVYAGIFLGVNAYAELEKVYTDELFTIGLPGWSIPGIVDLGPELTLAAEAEVRVEVLGQILLGASVTWPNIQATLDFVNSSASSHSGWTPIVQTQFQSQSQITAYASLGMPLTIGFGIDILDGTWEKELSLTESPALAATARYDEQFNLTVTTNTTSGSSAVNFTDTPDNGCYGVSWNISLINDVTLDLVGLDSFDLAHWESPALASGCIGGAAVSATGTTNPVPTSISLIGPPTGLSTAAVPTSTAVASPGGGSCDSVTCPDDDNQTCNNGAELFTVSCEVVYSAQQLANLNLQTLGECINACATTYAPTCRGVSFFGWAYVDPSSDPFDFPEEEANCFPFAVAQNPATGENANSGWSAVISSVSKRDTPTIPRRIRRDDAPANTTANVNTLTIADSTGALLLNPGIDGNLFMSVANSTTNITALNNETSFMADFTSNIVYGDDQGRLLHYYPAEMAAVNVSRIRLAAWGYIPIGAQLVELAPITVGSDTMLVAFDTLGNYYWPFMCGLEGMLNKVFLVADLDNGAATLKSPDLQFVITGGIVETCGPLALEAQGLDGFVVDPDTAGSSSAATSTASTVTSASSAQTSAASLSSTPTASAVPAPTVPVSTAPPFPTVSIPSPSTVLIIPTSSVV